MKDKLIEYIGTDILADQSIELTPEEDLLESGLIDSLGFMRIIAFMEENFDIKVPPKDMTIENFITVNAMEAYLNIRKTQS